jgi:hypothetical protein
MPTISTVIQRINRLRWPLAGPEIPHDYFQLINPSKG